MVKPLDMVPDTAVETDHPEAGADRRYVLERFQKMETFWSPIHEAGLEDDRFVSGDQWPRAAREEREEKGRPCLTYNMLPSFTHQIINKVRQERPQVRVVPVESDRGQTPDISNIQGTQDYSLADVYMGIVRHTEHVSRADHAYDTALTHAVNHGFGYFHLVTRYAPEDPFVQDFRIERIRNPYTVLIDPAAQAADLSDAQDAFLFSQMTREAFERKYPDANPSSFEMGASGQSYEGWYDREGIRVATYYWVEHVDDVVLKMSNGKVHYLSMVEKVLDEMHEKYGITVARDSDSKELRRKVKRPVVKWRKLTGTEWLTEETETPFETIPLFAVLGDELIVDGITQYHSAIRHARDAQMSYNYWRTAAAETVAIQPRAPWVISNRQIDGYEKYWESANRENMPALVYNHVDGVQPPQRGFPANPAAAELSNATQDSSDMQAIIGLHDASLGADGNEKSGKAILARQQQGSTSTYTFPDNLNRALESMGRCLVAAIPRVYDSSRVIRLRLPDDTEDFVEINKMERDDDTGEMVLVHDLGYGRYDVVIETGPSYATQRQEALEAQLELLGLLPPEQLQLVLHLVVRNMAFPGADQIASVLRKQVPEHLKSEDERAADLPKGVVFDAEGNMVQESSGEPYQPPLTPEMQIQQKTNEIEEAKTQAAMAEAQGDQAQAQAKMEKAKADMAEAQLEMAKLQQPQEPEAPAGPSLQDLRGAIEEVMDRHSNDPAAHREAFADAMAEAIADALRRVRAYVDKKTVPPANGATSQEDQP